MIPVPSSYDIRSIATDWALSPSKRGYIAPTFFMLKGKTLPRLNYYKTLADAFEKLRYTYKVAGSRDITPAGAVTFKADGTAQTAGINVDFYGIINNTQLVNIPYSIAKNIYSKGYPLLVRFVKPDGTGPYYCYIHPSYFGLSATVVSSYSTDKVRAMDELYREVALLKSKYNTLVTFLNELSKRTLTAKEQQIFNEGMLLKDSMLQQTAQIKGIELYYSRTGIGFIQLPVIAWIAITALIVAGTVTSIVQIREKTKRINDAYDVRKWITDRTEAILRDKTLSPDEKQKLIETLEQTGVAADKVIQNNSKPDAGGIMDALKFGIIGLIVIKGMDMVNTKK